MKKVTFLGILSAALALGALLGHPVTADAQPTPGNWNGVYAGINVGIARNYDNGLVTCVNPSGTVSGTGCVTPTFGHVTAQGGLAGGQAGYNFQFYHFVVGPELDWDISTIGGRTAFTGLIPEVSTGGSVGTFSASESIGSLASGRLRLGWADPKMLIYITGGYARADGTAQSNYVYASDFQYPASRDFQTNGFTEGIGGEWKVQPKTSVKLELTEFHLSDITTLGPSTGAFPTGYRAGKHFDFRGFTLRTGVNFQI